MQAEFAQEVLGRLPLAEAVLTLWRWVADPLFLLSLFAHHRGAGYERVISLGGLVQLLAAALLEHRGSGRKSFARAREREHRHEALSSEFYCQMNEVGLGLEALPQPLGGGAPRAGGFGHQPFRSQTSAGEEGAEVHRGLKERLEPPLGERLEMAEEFTPTQCALLLAPDCRAQWGAEGVGEQNEEQPARERTSRALAGSGREGRQVESAFPGLKAQFDLPSSSVCLTDGRRRPHRTRDSGNKKVPGPEGKMSGRGGVAAFLRPCPGLAPR